MLQLTECFGDVVRYFHESRWGLLPPAVSALFGIPTSRYGHISLYQKLRDPFWEESVVPNQSFSLSRPYLMNNYKSRHIVLPSFTARIRVEASISSLISTEKVTPNIECYLKSTTEQ